MDCKISRLFLIIFPICVFGNSTTLLVLVNEIDGVAHFQFQRANGDQKLSFDISIVSMAMCANEIETTGWSTLVLMSSAKFSDVYQAYWSGYLETNCTHALTKAHWLNTLEGLCREPLTEDCEMLKKYLETNLRNTIEKAVLLSSKEEFWYQVLLQMWQLRGISDAFNQVFVENSTLLTNEYLLTLKDEVLGIYLLQLSGDLSDILKALSLKQLMRSMNKFSAPTVQSSSCSALIKLLPSDVYVSHVTWSPYNQMLRVMKHYNFSWKRISQGTDVIPGYAISFSSYPSVISSVDDFYITSSKLITMETTIGNSNSKLWSFVRDNASTCVMEPFRVMTANRLATNGGQWVSYFKQWNSGTYNNQWMIFDANVYSPGHPLPSSGLLTVAEQLPGTVYSEDVTPVLIRQTYWASYNLPYFPVIFNLSGMSEKVAKYGDVYDYTNCARAKIFARDHHTVHNMASMHKLMRYNNFKKDPLSRCNCTPPYTGEYGISSRSDLNDPDGQYPLSIFKYRLHGGTDVKIANMALLQTMNMLATSGPTYDFLPPFRWSTVARPVSKPLMHPDLWMFEPILTNFTDYINGLQQHEMPARPSLIPAFRDTIL